MKILHLLSSTGYYGAENMVAELIHQLTVLGIKNYIGVFYDNKKSNKDILNVVESSVEDSVIFPCNGKIDFKTVHLLHSYINSNNIEIIHSHKYKTNIYSLLASVRTNCKLISTCHNWLGESFNMRFYAWLDKNILRAFDAVVGVSDEVVNELKKYANNNKVKKVGNGVDIRKYHRVMEKDKAKKTLGLDGKRIIGFIGRLSHDKGISYLLEAASKILKNISSDICILIVGDGDFGENLKTQASVLGISDKVIFTGKRQDTPLIYSAMDVFVLPSLKEAFPMVILEAMACGVPVVATKVGDIPVIIENGINGLLVNTRDEEGLCKSISELLFNKDKVEQITKSAYKKVIENYSATIMAKKYKEVYMQVLN